MRDYTVKKPHAVSKSRKKPGKLNRKASQSEVKGNQPQRIVFEITTPRGRDTKVKRYAEHYGNIVK